MKVSHGGVVLKVLRIITFLRSYHIVYKNKVEERNESRTRR